MICRALLGLIVFLNANWLLAESYRIGPEVPVSEPTLGPIGTIGFRSSAVFDGENYLAVWEDVRSLKREIYAARITPAGEVLDPLGIPLGITTVNLVSPKAVWTGTRHVVLATSDDPSETGNSYLMALSQAGEILQSPKRFLDRGSGLAMAVLAGNVLILRAKPDGVVIDVLDEQGQLLEANLPFPGRSVLTLAAADRHALVVWTDQVGMFAVRLDSSGHVLDSTPLNIATTPYPASFRIASNGRDFLVVMHQLNSRVQARFVWADGSLGAPFVLSNEPVERAEVAAAWLDDRYVVAWTNAGSIFATELRSDGTLTSPGLVSRYAAVTGLSLAAGAGSVLAVWYGSGEQSGRKVYAKRTSDPSSTEILVSSAASRQTVPDLAANADEFAVTWLESLDREFEAAIASITISEGRTSGTKVLRQSEAGRLLTAGRFQPEGQHGWLLWEERALRTYPPRTAVRGQLVGPSGTETIVFSDFEKSGAAPTLVRGDSLSIVLWIEQLKVHGSLVAVNGRDLATFQISTAPMGNRLRTQPSGCGLGWIAVPCRLEPGDLVPVIVETRGFWRFR